MNALPGPSDLLYLQGREFLSQFSQPEGGVLVASVLTLVKVNRPAMISATAMFSFFIFPPAVFDLRYFSS
ncbi:MAG: hypothetical protein AAF699_22210 [Pseudomonadota bacterium]